jgi:hypothetical protein
VLADTTQVVVVDVMKVILLVVLAVQAEVVVVATHLVLQYQEL